MQRKKAELFPRYFRKTGLAAGPRHGARGPLPQRQTRIPALSCFPERWSRQKELTRITRSSDCLVQRRSTFRLCDPDQKVTYLQCHVIDARFVGLGHKRGSLDLQFLSGASNPPPQGRGITLRPKGAANDRTEVRNHTVTKSGDCGGVSPDDCFAEIPVFFVF